MGATVPAFKYGIGDLIETANFGSYFQGSDGAMWLQAGSTAPFSALGGATVKARLENNGYSSIGSEPISPGSLGRMATGRVLTVGSSNLWLGDVTTYHGSKPVLFTGGAAQRVLNWPLGNINNQADVDIAGKIRVFSASSSNPISTTGYQSTDGLTYTSYTITWGASVYLLASAGSTNTPYAGKRRITYTNGGQDAACDSGVFFCGARFVAIGNDNASQGVASIDTDGNGTTFGTNVAASVLGSTSQISTNGFYFFHRNGNSCFFYTSAHNGRYTTNGGVAWSASTGITGVGTNSFKANRSNAAKIALLNPTSGLILSTDTGATWTNKTLATMGVTANGSFGSWEWFGSIIVVLTNTLAVSTDDGATWAAITLPALTGSPNVVLCDGFRFYVFTSANEVYTSTNGTTWTRRTSAVSLGVNSQSDIAAKDTNTVVVTCNTSQTVTYSTDGGVTWKQRIISQTAANGWAPVITYAANGDSFLVNSYSSDTSNCACYILPASDLTSATSGTAKLVNNSITPQRTNASVYVRVG